MKHKKSTQELNSELAEQRAELRDRCAAYDSGKSWEAKSLATSLYKFLWDGKNDTKALLTLIDVKEKIPYLNTSEPNYPNNLAIHCPLIMNQMDFGSGVSTFLPILNEPIRRIRYCVFQEWWDDVVYAEPNGATLSRKEIINTMRSQDGGSHVDEGIRNTAYRNMAVDVGISVLSKDGKVMLGLGQPGGDGAVPDAHRATLRQIAHEFETSIDRYFDGIPEW